MRQLLARGLFATFDHIGYLINIKHGKLPIKFGDNRENLRMMRQDCVPRNKRKPAARAAINKNPLYPSVVLQESITQAKAAFSRNSRQKASGVFSQYP